MLVRQTEGKIRLLRFLPDGRRLVVVAEHSDSQMRFSILDTATGDSIPLPMPGGNSRIGTWSAIRTWLPFTPPAKA
jgi:hypothetical protein